MSTPPPPSAPKTGGRPGRKFPWAGNISHPNDPTIVSKAHECECCEKLCLTQSIQTIPDLENEEIVALKLVKDLAERLTHFRDDDAQLFADNGEVQYSDRRLNVQVEDFRVCGLAMRRYKYKGIDCFATNPYRYCAQANRYDNLTSQGALESASNRLVQWQMAKDLLEHNGELGGRVLNRMKTAYVRACKALRERRSEWPDMEKQLQADMGNEALQHWWTQTKAKNINLFRNPYLQCDRDLVAVADPNILEPVDGQDFVLVLDKNNELITFCASKTVQKLFSDSVLEKIYTGFDIWTYHQAIPKPDPTRHPLQMEFLRDHPQFDCEVAQEKDLAKCGVEHFGIRERVGDPHGTIMFPVQGSLGRYWRSDNLYWQVYLRLQRGAWRVLTKTSSFFFRPLMPALYDDYVDVCQAINKDLRMDTVESGEPFTLRALLVNLGSEDHTDSKDIRYGIAALTPLGHFEGTIPSEYVAPMLTDYPGADLVLRQLNLRISYPPGSVVLIRGHELAHSTTEWTGESRFVVVQTSHEAVREHAYRNLGREYPPLALAPNFGTEASKRGKAGGTKIKTKTKTEIETSTPQAESAVARRPSATEDKGKEEAPSSSPKPLPDNGEAAEAAASPSDHSSDTDMSCRDYRAIESPPDLDVEPDERGYMDFAFIEDMEGPLYYKLRPKPRKRKRSDETESDDDDDDEYEEE